MAVRNAGVGLSAWCSQAGIVYLGHEPYNFAWWTLTIEVAFYVLAPLLVVLLRGRSDTTAWGLFALTVGASLVVGVWTPMGGSTISTARFLSYASCFAGGLLIAKQDIAISTRARLAGLGGVVVIASSIWAPINCHVGYRLLYMAVVSQAMEHGARAVGWLEHPWMI